ncbi:MAG: hypothetical protein N3F08_02495 [Crenarchaeota archaeon]|nr:hypothetical protein [Thermoproteota archaeon]
MIYGLNAALERLREKIGQKLGLEWPPAPRYWGVLKEEIKNVYPHVAELTKEIDISIKRMPSYEGKVFLLWPIEVIGIPTVMEEVEALLKGNVFSGEDPGDRRFMERIMAEEKPSWAKTVNEFIETTNRGLVKRGKFLKGAYEIYKKYNVQLFLWTVYT